MRIFVNTPKILFFKNHINNLIKSSKSFGILSPAIKLDIFKLRKINLNKNKKYNHLLRIALNKNTISISLPRIF